MSKNFEYGEVERLFKIGDVSVWVFRLKAAYYSDFYSGFYPQKHVWAYVDAPSSEFKYPKIYDDVSHRFILVSDIDYRDDDDCHGDYKFNEKILDECVKNVADNALNANYSSNDIKEIAGDFTWDDAPDIIKGSLARDNVFDRNPDYRLWTSADSNHRFELWGMFEDNECTIRDYKKGLCFDFNAASGASAIDAAKKIADTLISIDEEYKNTINVAS